MSCLIPLLRQGLLATALAGLGKTDLRMPLLQKRDRHDFAVG
eukprot:CAMPEP_0180668586 /NCGR_PEP_ID=MMETSP1037_2-20121125/63007_1 /TAXON_ID=632150 /ORGANISM="Azadinium spinosum, Strain 3D9" /LENGTH=41 /DNA_ID= /DNA_START= /DNA_END= /DNA_ORIENTATION=